MVYEMDINSLVTNFLIGETATWNDVVPRSGWGAAAP